MRIYMVIIRKIREKTKGSFERAKFVGSHKIYNSAHSMNLGSPQIVGANVFSQNRLNHTRPGQSEKGSLTLDHKRSLTREIRTSTRIEPKHEHDTRNNPAD